ncbi:MAG: hypothetical protein N2Z63_05440 [Thiobacillaceae bacterium]|nr:hypothetical protein [Thiobacillaceae bacterium]
MIIDRRAQERLERLSALVRKDLLHLQRTDARLFAEPFTPERAARLAEDDILAERVEAFVARFGRLQDTLGDKVLPAWLAAHGERPGSFADNLDRAERLGLVEDAQTWIDMRKLRDLMVHEYVDDPTVLASALQSGHAYVPVLARTAERMTLVAGV